MRYTINLDCKTHHVGRDGKFPILLRISLNGKQDYINTGKRILEEHYDKEKKSIKSGIKGFNELDRFVSRNKGRIESIIDDFDKKGGIPTISKIKSIYEQETGKVKSKCFYEFVEEMILEERQITKKTKGTLKNCDDQLFKLLCYMGGVTKSDVTKKRNEWKRTKQNDDTMDWTKYRIIWLKGKSKCSIHDVDEPFIKKYETYILKELGQAKNTSYHALCFLRKYTKILYENKRISPYPFEKIEVGSPHLSDPEYLEPEELKRLHDLYDSKELLLIIKKAKSKHARDFKVGEKYQEILRYFLVACYTGLRHSDIKTLRTSHIKGSFIVKKLEKGREGKNKIVRIPIRKRLLSLIDIKNTKDLFFENPVMEDSQTNNYLKNIMEIANINKHITFHCARHTFSIISLLLGMKFEVVSDILGHSELTTTQRYARVVDPLRDKEMDKWDKLAKVEFVDEELLSIYCPNCENLVLSLKKSVIQLTVLPCRCELCERIFKYPLKERELALSNNLSIAS
jgi:integrase